MVDSVGDNSYLATVRRGFNKDLNYTKSNLYNLIAYVKKYQTETGDTLKIIYSANAFQHMLKLPPILPSNSNFNTLYNETYNAVKLLKDSGLIVYGVELGNETYCQRMFYDIAKYPNANQNRLDYISILKQYSLNLKSQFSGIKVSVPIIWTAPINPGNVPGKLTSVIAQDNALFDAYSYHHYTSTLKHPSYTCLWDCFAGQLCSNTDINLFKCYSFAISDYIQPVGQGNTCDGGVYLYNQLRQQRLNPQFNSSNKKIWLTEWNNAQATINNSLVSADFVFRAINFFIDNQDSLNLGVSNYWGFGGIYDDLTPYSIRNVESVDAGQYSSLNPCSNTRGSTFTYMNQNGINRVNLLANYHPHKFLSQIFTNNQVKPNQNYTLTIPNNAKVNDDNFVMKPYLSKVSSYQTGTTSNGSTISKNVFDLYLYYSNKSDSSVYINYDSLNISINPPQIVCVQAPCMDKYYADILNITQEYIEAPSLNYYFRNSNYKKTGNGTIIKPRSIGYIKIPMYYSYNGGGNGNSSRKRNIVENERTLNIYPNPTTGIITFDTKNDNYKIIQIFDIAGKLITNSTFDSDVYKFDMSSYPKTEYIYKIIDENNFYTGKFIVQ